MKNQPETMKNHEKQWKIMKRFKTIKNMKNHEKPRKTNLEPWKTMKNHEKPWKKHEKPTWNHEKLTWNHEKPWKKQQKTNFILHFCNTFHLHWGSTAFLWSKKRHMTNTRPQPTSGISKCSFFVTSAGSQLTFMTQNGMRKCSFFVTHVGSQLTF